MPEPSIPVVNINPIMGGKYPPDYGW